MTAHLPLFIMVACNLWAAIGQAIERNYMLAIVFTCYAVSTLALLIIALRGTP